MDFFERQEKAQRTTGVLLFYFVCAVILTVAGTAAVIYFALFSTRPDAPVDWSLIAVGASIAFLLILLGSLKRWWELRSGGSAVAQFLGALRVPPDTSNPEERKLLNVVEEMAIASGSAVPPVYVLDGEEGINAFAAGFSPADSVVVVTRGAINSLNRDELQGVIAHEMAHLLNGDTRLNLKLMGVLGGILVISAIGKSLLRARRARGSREDGRALAPRFSIGVGLYFIGMIGYFFGKLIQAAVSRQREFLADASAVQFTRNPIGIGGALLKIRQTGSDVLASGTDEVRHFFFAESLRPKFLQSWLATHPELDDRIRAIDPALLSDAGPARSAGADAVAPGVSAFSGAPHEAGTAVPKPAAQAFGSGKAGPEVFAAASTLIATLPEALLNAARTPAGAQAGVVLLLLEKPGTVREAQNRQLGEFGKGILDLTAGLEADARRLVRAQRLHVLELALSALKLLSTEERRNFVGLAKQLILADSRTTVFEFVVLSILSEQLLSATRKGARVSYYAFEPITTDCMRVLSLLAHVSANAGGTQNVDAVFQRGMSVIFPLPGQVLPLDQCKPDEVEASLHRIRGLSPGLKGEFVKALIAAALEDDVVRSEERELLTAIGLAIDCPIAAIPDSVRKPR